MYDRTRTEMGRRCRSCGRQGVRTVTRKPVFSIGWKWLECETCSDEGPYALPGLPIPKATLANAIMAGAR